ncbi:MAG: peptidoglycan-binding protein [Fibrobacteria bacterium]|nr:peptidoglycan-binding protein [Fibrobacteria bacterium]
MNPASPRRSPFGGSSPFDGPSLLDRYHGKPMGEIRFPKAAAPPRPAVDPDYLAKTRESDPWPEGSSCAPASSKPAIPLKSVVLSNCRFLTPSDQLRFNEPFEMAVDVRRTAPGKVRRAFFDLHQSWIRDGIPEEQSIVRGIEGFPESDGDTHTIKAKEVLETAMPYVLGETVEFWLTATHLEADAAATSSRVQVPLKAHAHWLGGSDILFDLGSSFPRLGPDGRLASVLAASLKRTANPPHPENPESSICFGYASASGNADHNRKLSLRRAQAVKAILDRDEKAWETLAKEAFRTVDLQQLLADLAHSEGIGCDPGPVDGVAGSKTKSAVTAFQIHANATWNLGLEVDGDCGRRTLKAILRQILALVQQELGKDPSKAPEWKTPLWGHEGKGVYGNGEDFAGAQENPDERSVQIMFFAAGNEPLLKDVPENIRVTVTENPVEDSQRSFKHRIVLPPSVPKSQRGKFHYLEIPDYQFRSGGHMPCAAPIHDLIGRFASAIAFSREHYNLTPKAYGHASAGGGYKKEQDVSSRRARAIAAFLTKDAATWKDLSDDSTVEELQSILAGFDTLPEWNCNPGPIDGINGPRTRNAVKSWQRHFNSHHELQLLVDGIAGPVTWEAIRIKLSELVGSHLGQHRWAPLKMDATNSDSCQGCGSAHPPDAVKHFHLVSRRGARVDILFGEQE